MRISLATDYALRCLLFLALTRDEWVPASAIAARFGISANHVRQVCKTLVGHGWLEGRRGAGGGVRLAPGALDLRLGEVIGQLEVVELAECFGPEAGVCSLEPGCALKSALASAEAVFFAELNRCQLKDLISVKELERLVGETEV